MLTAKPKTKRCLETIQFVLTLASTCTIVETIRVDARPDDRPGFYAGTPLGDGARDDRRLGDLARSERKRREAELKEALEQKQLRA